MVSAQNQSSEISHFRICLHILEDSFSWERSFHDIVRAKILQSLPWTSTFLTTGGAI